MLNIYNLSAGYGDKVILKNIGLKVTKGELIGIIGPNGSGKTTLFRVITKLIFPKSGEICFKGNNLQDISYRELAKELAVVSQDADGIMQGMNVEEYVLLGRIPHRKQFQFFEGKKDYNIAHKAMEYTGVLKLKDRFINELSSGERQRVFFGRALCQEPQLLLLDEPTAHLDIAHQIELMELVKTLNKDTGLTVVIIMHDLNLASAYCDRLILMKEGVVYKDGNTEDVLTYQIIEDVYKTVVVVEKSKVTKKPYVFVSPRQKA
jgi:iron complex transport system ATP-binding protein